MLCLTPYHLPTTTAPRLFSLPTRGIFAFWPLTALLTPQTLQTRPRSPILPPNPGDIFMSLPAPESKYKTYGRTRPVKWWHEAIIDDLLLHPLDTAAMRSKRLGYTPAALYGLMNSDMFRAAYEARRANIRDRLDDGIHQKLAKAANLGLEVLIDKLEEKRTSIPFKDLVAANDSILSRLGYGTPAPGTNVNVNVNAAAPPVTRDDLAEARKLLREVESMRVAQHEPKVIEAMPEPTRSVRDVYEPERSESADVDSTLPLPSLGSEPSEA